MLSLPVIATFIAIGGWFVNNIISKRISVGLGMLLPSTIVVAVGILPMAIGTLVLGTYSIPLVDILLSFLSGVFAFVGTVLIYRALFTEQLTNTVALQEVSPPILVLLGAVVLSEPLSLFQGVSIAVIFIGTLFVITNEKWRINKKLIPALLSVLSWAAYWIVMTYAVNGAGTFALPVLISRVVATALLVGYLFMHREAAFKQISNFKKTPKQHKLLLLLLGLAVIAGLTDGVGDLLFAFTVGAGAVAIGGALSALSPIAVVVFCFFVYKDRMTPTQFAGFVMMVIGALALSLA